EVFGQAEPAELVADDFTSQLAAAGEFHRREEFAIGHLLETFMGAADADEGFHQIVVGREVLVADGPVFAVAITAGRFELVVAVTIAFATPAKGSAADLATTNPHERFVDGKRVRIFAVVDKELMAVLIAGETQPLNGLAIEECLSVAEAAELYLIRADMLGKVAGRYTGRSGLQHQDTHTLLGELLSYPATTGSGADNHRVKELFADTHRRMRMLSRRANLGTDEDRSYRLGLIPGGTPTLLARSGRHNGEGTARAPARHDALHPFEISIKVAAAGP